MEFASRPVTFTLKDIGSEIIDQLTHDVYTQSDSILREIIKNAYDSYLGLDPDDLDDEDEQRVIIVSRSRDEKAIGHLFVTDHATGQTLDDLKANLQLSISRKQEELTNATGFRGLGSWALLGGGSKATITSRKSTSDKVARLTVNIREIYKLMGPSTTLDEILNNTKCVSFGERGVQATDAPHFTTVEIICDGPRARIQQYEINRLYEFTDPHDKILRDSLLGSCQIPFAVGSSHYERIAAIYKKAGYHPTAILLDGERLEKHYPGALSNFETATIKVGGKIAAEVWFAEHPSECADCEKHLGKDSNMHPSIRLFKFNSPIGDPGVYGNYEQQRLLKWYIGEVHIRAADLLPDADGRGLRAGTPADAFIQDLSNFYDDLAQRARDKSKRRNLIKKFDQGVKAAKKLQDSSVSAGEKIELQAQVKTAIEAIQTSKAKKDATNGKVATSNVFSDVEIEKARKQTRKFLKTTKWWSEITGSKKKSAEASKPADDGKSSATSMDGHVKATDLMSTELLQARLGLAIPRLKKLGLDEPEIEEVFAIIVDVLMPKV